MPRKLIVANWKENPATEREAVKLFSAVAKAKKEKNVDIVICPPFIYLEKMAEILKKDKKAKVQLGAQDVFWEEKGAFTSEVGPKMLKRLGAKYAIIGHSERRRLAGDTDAIINKKVKAAMVDGLKVILCVGEPLAIRKRGLPLRKNMWPLS